MYADAYVYSEILTADLEPAAASPSIWQDEADDRTCAEAGGAAEEAPGAFTEAACSEIFACPASEYASSLSDGAVLVVTENLRFLYRVARRYEYVSEPSFTFDLLFTASGQLQEEEGGLRLMPEDATVACSSFSNGTEVEQALAQNVIYTAYGVQMNERMLAGEALSLDEFLGSDAFAQLLSTPVFVTLDTETQCFALSRPLLGD